MTNANAFEEVKKNFHSGVGKKYSKADVVNVWDTVAKFVEDNLHEEKGVNIKDFGTFSLSEWKLEIGNKSVQVKKPVFMISEKLVKFYNLKTNNPFTSGKISTPMLNIVAVSEMCNHPRQLVSDCIDEVIQAFTRILGENKDVEFPFSGIGKLQVKSKQVHMKFYQDFLNRIDKLFEDYKCERPSSSASSILTGPATPLHKYRPTDGFFSVLPATARSNRSSSSSVSSRSNDSNASSRSGTSRSKHGKCADGRPSSSHSSRSSKSSRPPTRSKGNGKEAGDFSKDSNLCYVCRIQTQRAHCNKPRDHKDDCVDKAKNRMDEMQLLTKDAEEVMADWAKMDERRKKNEEFAQFNKQWGEEKKQQLRDKPNEPLASYVLYKRPDSQKDQDKARLQELKRDIESRERRLNDEKNKTMKQDKENLLKSEAELEQMRWDKAKALQDKKKEYRYLLDAQRKCKEKFKDVFAQDDTLGTDLRGVPLDCRDPVEEKRKAAELAEYHQYQIKRKQDETKETHEQKIKDEQDWLKAMKEEGLAEKECRTYDKKQNLQNLADCWKKGKEQKELFRVQEKENIGHPGFVLEDVCSRCDRCQKKLGHPPERVSSVTY